MHTTIDKGPPLQVIETPEGRLTRFVQDLTLSLKQIS